MSGFPELKIRRHHPAKRGPQERGRDFAEIGRGLTALEAMAEARRCVQCADPPCAKLGCPLNNRIPVWIDHIVEGRFRQAARVLAQTNNMPEACGKLCPQERLCESRCVVGLIGEPVAIGRLEAFVTQLAREKGWYRATPVRSPSGFRVAVVGGGPAGLAAAEELLDYGHAVTVYERHPAAGGLLIFGIPGFKYDKNRVAGLVERLQRKGAEFECGVTVSRDVPVEDLVEQYDAVLLAIGAEEARAPDFPGAELANVFCATDFLVQANVPAEWRGAWTAVEIDVGRRCVVVGGGDTAMDCVRSAVRLGFEDVRCLYRRTAAEMKSRAEDKQHAIEEGVQFDYLVVPKRLVGDDAGRVSAVECVRTKLGAPDRSGRPRPEPIAGSEFNVAADAVVLALGYTLDESLAAKIGCTVKNGRLQTDESLRTTRPGVFAAGDAVRGADLIVTAVKQGRRAAAGIDAYLRRGSGAD
jgi:glutamate synthase (NADPH/NADH) small chain